MLKSSLWEIHEKETQKKLDHLPEISTATGSGQPASHAHCLRAHLLFCE